MKNILAAALCAILLLLVVPELSDAEPTDADSKMLLIDWGNGQYAWYGIDSPKETLIDTAISTLDSNGVGYDVAGNAFTSVGGRGNCTVATQSCEWRFYIWDSYQWVYGDTSGDEPYHKTTLALGFCPEDSLVPVPTPYFKNSWTSVRGTSSNTGISVSEGPTTAAYPLEWYLKSQTGGVYSSILSADGLLYYVTGGDVNGDGINRSPHLYCVDSINHEVSWTFTYSISTSKGNQQFEIDTPVIVGDMIIITSANRHIYCLDRFDGSVLSELVPGTGTEKAHFASRFDTYYYTYESTSALSGSIYSNGPTTAVYDSGALYFNTHDGAMHCYSVSRDNGFTELWKCIPEPASRGCFYFSAPTIAYVDGVRTVVSGSYSGHLYCVDADTGLNLRTAKIGELGGVVGAPAKIVPIGDGSVIVSVDDGELSPRNGFTARIDLTDFSMEWKLDLFGSSTVVLGDKIYGYLKASRNSTEPGYDRPQVWDKDGIRSDARTGFYSISAEDGHVVWCSPNDAYTKSGMVYCDGRLYCADYSTTFEWPVGGAVRCIDPDSGRQIWAMKMEPGTSGAYCMSTPTVIDGKVYIGNDDGTIYCISDIPGEIDPRSQKIGYSSDGLTHWSWLLLFTIMALTMVSAAIMYRR